MTRAAERMSRSILVLLHPGLLEIMHAVPESRSLHGQENHSKTQMPLQYEEHMVTVSWEGLGFQTVVLPSIP